MYDVDAMIQAADLEAMLTELGMEPVRRKNKNGFELYFHCFNPEHSDDQRKMSMAEAGKYKGLFYCWSCKFRGNITQIIQHFAGVNFHTALEWMKNRTGVGELMGTQSLIYKVKKEKLNYGHVAQSEMLPTFELPEDFKPCCAGHADALPVERFLLSRGIREESMQKFGVGVSIYRGLGHVVTVPIRFQGQIHSIFFAQPWTGGEKRYPKDSPQGDILFNYDECLEYDRYAMVESVLDVMKIDSLSLGPAMACFTNMVSDRQIDLLKPFSNHAVFPDMDSERGWDLVTRMVGGLDKSVRLILPPVGKDPGDCEGWEVVDSYAQCKSYADWEVERYISSTNKPAGNVIRLKKK